jgi:hypothetical protein
VASGDSNLGVFRAIDLALTLTIGLAMPPRHPSLAAQDGDEDLQAKLPSGRSK